MLKDKVAVVTGGTRGIGFATVQTFLDNGCKVVLFGSRQESVDKALAKLDEINPDYAVEGMYPKLTDEAEIKEAFATIKEKYGKIDILVNNAGVAEDKPIENLSVEDFQRTIDLNVNAIYVCTKAVTEIMKDQGEGVILNTSSMVSLYGQASGCSYPASKFAVNGLTKSLARELGSANIRVNAVAPGVIATDMVANLPEEVVERIASTIPFKRMGQPEDIANAFLFLASDMASYVTGEILSVDGATMT